MMSANKPIHQIRLGHIKAAIWENEAENGVRYIVTITRLYKDGNDEWQDSGSFGRDDLPLVEKVCHMAHLWIFSCRAGANQAVAGDGASHEEES